MVEYDFIKNNCVLGISYLCNTLINCRYYMTLLSMIEPMTIKIVIIVY